MKDRQTSSGKSKPFPWCCPNCAKDEVYPAQGDYTATVKKDGYVYAVPVPNLQAARCRECGTLVFSNRSGEQIERAVQEYVRALVLQPEQIRSARKRLQLTQSALAERLGVAEETISRWETGTLVPSRAMDNLLRVFFAMPAVREVLVGKDQDKELGTSVTVP